MITLLDPVGVWASSVIKALSDAGGRPIERLHLREQTTLRTIAMIERTMLVRRHEDTLRIFHADVRAPGPENAEIPVALMERSQMTAVIIGPMQPHAIDALLGSLRHATSLPTWRCAAPALPAAAERGLDQRQGRGGRLARAASRAHRERADDRRVVGLERDAQRLERGEAAAGLGSGSGLAHARHERFPDQGRRPRQRQRCEPRGGARRAPRATRRTASVAPRATLDAARGRQALSSLLKLDGLLGCALVDAASGLVLAHETRDPQSFDMELAAAACAQVLGSHRNAAQSMGLADPIDEVITTAGARHVLIRALQRHPELVLVALLEKNRTNLALARFQLLEVERALP